MTPSRRLSHVIAASGAVLALVVALIAAGDLYRRYHETTAEAERRTVTLSDIVGEHVARTFEAIDRVLLTSAASCEDHLNGLIATPQAAHDRLSAIHSGSPMLLGLGWIDSEGWRIAGTEAVSASRINVAAEESFAVHRENRNAGLFVSRPFRPSPSEPWIIKVTRRVEKADGTFLGVVDGVLNIGYFLSTYSRFDPTVASVVTLFRDDGISLIRSERTDETIGQSGANGPLFAKALPKAPAGTIEAESPFDGTIRILSYKRVTGLPLVVAVSFEKNEVLKPWLAGLAITGGVTLLVVIAILAATLRLRALASANEQYQHDLAAATARADAASRAKSDFLATMSHEVRTPMTGIIGYSDLLFAAERDPKLKDYARIVGDSARALLSILDDILDLSTIEAGRLALREGPVDPVKIAADAVAIIAAAAREKGVVIAVRMAEGVPRALLGDRDRLRQIITNLLANAVKFTERGRIDVTIERLGAVDGGQEIRISVADTGIGIPKEALDRLFVRFSQVDNSIGRRFGGTGLGLAICKRLVERMGGRIGVESEPGRGSTFWFTVVLPPASPDAGIAEADPAPATGRVLVVDDNLSNLRLVQAMLGAVGHEVDTAADGSIALERIAGTDYDVVLMDLNMPVMDGFEATRRIRSLAGAKSRVPIVALTASATPEEAERCRRAGMDGHVGKPIETEALLSAVADYIPDPSPG